MPIRYLPHTRFARANRKFGASYPSVLDDGNTVAWFDYLLNVTKETGDLVSSWDNVSGISGIIAGALLQGTNANRPKWLDGDGIHFGYGTLSSFMETAGFTYEQPEQIYIVMNQPTWAANQYIFDSAVTRNGSLYKSGTTPDLKTRAGADLVNSNLATNTWGIIRILLHGAASKIQVNETAATEANAGVSDMNGLTLGARATGDALHADVKIKEAIFRKVADNATDEASIYNYLKNKYGL